MAWSAIEESDSDSDHSTFLVNTNRRPGVLSQPSNPQPESARGSESSESLEERRSSSSSNESGFFTAAGPSGNGMAFYSSLISLNWGRGGGYFFHYAVIFGYTLAV